MFFTAMTDQTPLDDSEVQFAPKREIFAWAMYDFANSGYTTVVLTTLFSTYFVSEIAGSVSDFKAGTPTLLWSLAIALANAIVLFSAPVLGAMADQRGLKKVFLAASTLGCTLATAALAGVGPGDVFAAMFLVILATVMFSTGENLIASFLPEIAPVKELGRISGYGWALGYIGGMTTLLACLGYLSRAEQAGLETQAAIPGTLLITAAIFAIAATPTFLWLKERRPADPDGAGLRLRASFVDAVRETINTVKHARHYRDLFRFLLSLSLYNCGVYTVIILASIYARDVFGFSTKETIYLILLVNTTAAFGALVFGELQSRISSRITLVCTLVLWIGAVLLAYTAETRSTFWIASNLVGLALGSSQSAGRALVGQLTPLNRTAEFFGLWGVAVKLSAIAGPLAYGSIIFFTQGNHRSALLSTLVFFVAGLLVLLRVDEERGERAAHTLNVAGNSLPIGR